LAPRYLSSTTVANVVRGNTERVRPHQATPERIRPPGDPSVSDSTMRPVQTFADHLSSLIQPTSWDISVATVVERLAHWIDSDSLRAHRAARRSTSPTAPKTPRATWRVPAQPWWQRSSSSVTGSSRTLRPGPSMRPRSSRSPPSSPGCSRPSGGSRTSLPDPRRGGLSRPAHLGERASHRACHRPGARRPPTKVPALAGVHRDRRALWNPPHQGTLGFATAPTHQVEGTASSDGT
jgi:hypothetical protein